MIVQQPIRGMIEPNAYSEIKSVSTPRRCATPNQISISEFSSSYANKFDMKKPRTPPRQVCEKEREERRE